LADWVEAQVVAACGELCAQVAAAGGDPVGHRVRRSHEGEQRLAAAGCFGEGTEVAGPVEPQMPVAWSGERRVSAGLEARPVGVSAVLPGGAAGLAGSARVGLLHYSVVAQARAAGRPVNPFRLPWPGRGMPPWSRRLPGWSAAIS
jgi:hypothetical protein